MKNKAEKIILLKRRKKEVLYAPIVLTTLSVQTHDRVILKKRKKTGPVVVSCFASLPSKNFFITPRSTIPRILAGFLAFLLLINPVAIIYATEINETKEDNVETETVSEPEVVEDVTEEIFSKNENSDIEPQPEVFSTNDMDMLVVEVEEQESDVSDAESTESAEETFGGGDEKDPDTDEEDYTDQTQSEESEDETDEEDEETESVNDQEETQTEEGALEETGGELDDTDEDDLSEDGDDVVDTEVEDNIEDGENEFEDEEEDTIGDESGTEEDENETSDDETTSVVDDDTDETVDEDSLEEEDMETDSDDILTDEEEDDEEEQEEVTDDLSDDNEDDSQTNESVDETDGGDGNDTQTDDDSLPIGEDDEDDPEDEDNTVEDENFSDEQGGAIDENNEEVNDDNISVDDQDTVQEESAENEVVDEALIRAEIEKVVEARIKKEYEEKIQKLLEEQEPEEIQNFQSSHNFEDAECEVLSDNEIYCRRGEVLSGGSETADVFTGVFAQDGDDDSEIIFQYGGQTRQITDNFYSDINPVYDEKSDQIAWQSLVDGRWQIMVHDLAKDTTEQVSGGGFNNINPYISDDVVVWQGWAGNNWDIFYAQHFIIEDKTESWGTVQVTDNTWSDIEPRVVDGVVLWEAFIVDSWQVFSYEIDVDELVQVSQGKGDNRNPRFVVLWDNEEDGAAQTIQYNISTGERSVLNTTEKKDDDPLKEIPVAPLSKDKAALPVTENNSRVSTTSNRESDDSE